MIFQLNFVLEIALSHFCTGPDPLLLHIWSPLDYLFVLGTIALCKSSVSSFFCWSFIVICPKGDIGNAIVNT